VMHKTALGQQRKRSQSILVQDRAGHSFLRRGPLPLVPASIGTGKAVIS
jgi:hypothetical protein